MTKRTVVEETMSIATAQAENVFAANMMKAARALKAQGKTGYFAIDLRNGTEVPLGGPFTDEATLNAKLADSPDRAYLCIIQVA